MFSKRLSQTLRLLLIVSMLVTIIPAMLATPQPVYAQSETPTIIAEDRVASFSVPSPGLFFHTAALCPAGGGPNVAAADASIEDSPDAPEAASPFYIWRTTVRNEEARAVQARFDNSGATACNPYTLYSNIVADKDFVYWVDATGLVKLPVTANYYDTPTLMNAAYGFQLPVELLDDGNRLLVVSNLPVRNGPIGPTGGSFVESVDKVTGNYTVLYRSGTVFFPEEKGFRNIKTDGKYIYFVDKDRKLIRLDTSGDQSVVRVIGAAVSDYYPQGEVAFCPGIQCVTTDYVFYAQDNVIRRYSNIAGTDEPVQNLPSGATVPTLAISTFISVGTLFYFRTTFESSGGFGGTYTYSLYRSSTAPFDTPELLYFYTDSSVDGPPDAPANLTTDGTWLFWTEGAFGDPFKTLKRLPNDVDALPKVDMRITGMEVTQGVQNDANSVRLVKGRETYVRVFVRGDQNVQGATMRLYGTYSGSERGPLRPLRATHITAKVTPDVNQLGDSFLFVLPWEWSQQTSISLRAELNPFKVPPEPNYANNTLSGQTFNFSEGRAIDLIFVEANYRIQRSLNDFSDYFVSDTDVHVDWIRDAYPIPEDGLNYRRWAINGGALLGNHVNQSVKTCTDMPAATRSLCASDWVNAKIAQMRTNAGNSISASTLTYGLIVDSSKTGGFFPRGQAGVDRVGSGPAGVSMTFDAGGALSYSDYGYYTGHEIGHMYGRGHPVPNSDDPATVMDAAGNPIIEGCGHSRSDNDYPYANAFIGPGTGSIRGFDRNVPNSGGLNRQQVLNDTTSYDMMSYCGNSQLRWPSDYTWEGLYQGIINTPASIAQGSVAGDWLGLFGVVYGEDVIVHSVARMDDVTMQTPGNAGPLRLRLLGEGGNELAAYLFSPGDGDHAEDEAQPFALVVPFVTGTRSLEIVDVASSEVRYAAGVSASAPTVSEVALENPSNPVTGTVSLIWQAEDADGDTLSYDLFYSADGGASFQPVALGVGSTSTAIDTSLLAGGQGRFRVIANDGVNQGQADSPDYTMAVKSPDVRIVSPADGEHFNWGQTVNFSGEALDPQDGLLNGTAFAWSNQQGNLGTGVALLSVDDLPVGVNQITLTAQNSAGLSASTQITIYVGDELELPGPTLEVAPAGLSFHFSNGETAAKSLQLSLDNSGSGALTWSATSSAAWLTLDAASGNVPQSVTVTATPTGLAANQLHRATITLTGVSTGNPDQVIVVPVGASIGNSFSSPAAPVPNAPAGLLFLPQISDK